MNKFNKVIVILFSSLFLSFAANSTEVKFGHVGKPGSLFSASVDHFAKLANERLWFNILVYILCYGSG